MPVASLCIHSSDPRFNSRFAAHHRSSPPSPEPPSAGESVAVDVVLSVGQVHHPPTRKDTLKLLVLSDLPDSPWFDAGVHRSLRAPASFLNLTCGPPCQPLFYSPSNRFLLAPSGKIRFLLCACAFPAEAFSVFSVKTLELFCFITDKSLDRNLYNFLIKRDF